MPNYKPKKNHPNALKYRKDIEKRIVAGIKANLTIQAILDSIAHMNEAPTSTSSLYRIYGPAIEEARFDNQMYIGGALNQKVQEGDSKIIEFLARTKMGLNPTTQVREVEEGEENKDALSRLAQLLGKGDTDEE